MISVDEAWLKNQVLKDTLNVFKSGCDLPNYRILLMLPTTIDNVSNELEVGIKTTNTRVNMLEKHGLLKRIRGTGKLEKSDMTNIFLQLINGLTNEAVKVLPKYLDDYSTIA